MENKTPTAEEFLKNFNRQEGHTFEQSVPEAMIEFAKLHVEAALKEASEDANMDSDYYQALQVYPLTNIK
jgi:hypothetical protein